MRSYGAAAGYHEKPNPFFPFVFIFYIFFEVRGYEF